MGKRHTIRRCLILTLAAILALTSGSLVGCGEELQTFSKYGIAFKVSKELKLEEYTVSIKDQVFQKGTASHEEGAVISTEKNFILLWATAVPEFTQEEIRLSILTTPNSFESAGGTFQAKITGGLSTQQIAGFEVTFAMMQFTLPGWEAPGITGVWYCSASQRIMQLILIHKQPKKEMQRFIQSLSCE